VVVRGAFGVVVAVVAVFVVAVGHDEGAVRCCSSDQCQD
jgi:hypothetical protein